MLLLIKIAAGLVVAASSVAAGTHVVQLAAREPSELARPRAEETRTEQVSPGDDRAAVRREALAASQIARDEVGAAEIARGAVGTEEVRDGSLLERDLRAGELPAGRPGEPGRPGERGPRGEEGPQGLEGLAGAPGSTGRTGATGPPGERGLTGPVGPRGADGPPGADGSAGPTGATGPQGPPGSQGAQGARGAAGPVGPAGSAGAQGPAGPTGPAGPAGSAGSSTAREVYRDEDQVLAENADTTVATMASVAAGSYVVFAKTTIAQTSPGGGVEAPTRCTLDAGGTSTDYAEAELGPGDAGEGGRATLSMNVTAVFPSAGNIVVRCRRGANSGRASTSVARGTKIITIKLDNVSRTAVSG